MSNVLNKFTAVEKDARSFGFSYPSPDLIIEQIRDECNEVLEAIQHNESTERQQEEIGDLIHAALALCYHQGFDIPETIDKATNKFDARMQRLKSITKEEGLSSLHNQPLSYLIKLWKKAK